MQEYELEELEIIDIDFTEEEVQMYDLSVEDNHNFILEDDILTHNSGKTFLANCINSLFSFSHGKIKGTSVTQAGFLGGRSGVNSLFGRALWKPGVVETHDLLTIDEATESLEAFLDPRNLNLSNNVFYILKLLEDGGLRAVMDAQKTNPNAAITLYGNLEALTNIRNEYSKLVAKKYNFYSKGEGKHFNNNWPLFRPVKYYKDTLNNKALANAHAKVRMDYFKSKHYVTCLPEPNQGRIDWFIGLENDVKEYEEYDYTGDESISVYHREQFLEELNNKFKDMNKPPTEFVKNIHNFIIKDYFLNEPNNFVTHKTAGVKRQLFNRIVIIMSNLIWLNKHWMGENININVSDDEKDWIRYYLKFNYNVLNEDEAAMVVHPPINNIFIDSDELDDETGNIKKEFYEKKQKERASSEIVFEEMVNELPKDEFK